jgi:hypothetical protein
VNENDWDQLLWAIEEERCTPFLGAGACVPTLPTGAELAQEWAEANGYPFDHDARDLARVAEYLAIEQVPMAPKHAIKRRFAEVEPPAFEGDEPHRILAGLPIPVYLTTNYVDYMAQALRSVYRNPRVDFCRWTATPAVKNHPSQLPKAFVPTALEPVVYHLHGHLDVPQSLVLTETDYVCFLVEISRRRLLPHQIEKALANGSLIFIGYGFSDWDFRVLFRGLVAAQPTAREFGVTVQLETDDEASRKYLEKYFDELDLRVDWGSARTFVAELGRRWQERHPET